MDFLSDLAIVSRNGAELLNKAGVIDKIHAILKIEAASPDGGFLFTCKLSSVFFVISFQPRSNFLVA